MSEQRTELNQENQSYVVQLNALDKEIKVSLDTLMKSKDKMSKKRSALDEKQKIKEIIEEQISSKQMDNSKIRDATQSKQEELHDVVSHFK